MEKLNQINTESARITKWGIISTGRHPDQRIVPAMKLAERTKVVAVCSRNLETAEAFAQKHNIQSAYDSLDDFFSDPGIDAVFIASPNYLHALHTRMGARAGKHILVEKPMAVSVNEALEMVRICREHNVRFGVGFHLRHHPAYKKVKKLIQEGIPGHISMAQAQNFHLIDPPRWLQSKWWGEPEKVGGGYVIMGMGVHMIDLLQFLLGEPIVEVAAITDGQTADRPLERTGAVALRFRNGPIGTVCYGSLVPDTWNWNGATIYGMDGRISLRGDLSETLEVTGKSLNMTERYERNVLTLYKNQIEAFNRSVQQGEEFEASGIDGLSVVQVTSAVLESASTGRSVKVDRIGV